MTPLWILEDDENIRELVAYALTASGYEVRGFEAAAPLHEALGAGPLPALLLLDIMLPDEDGLSVLKKLRANPATARLPVMLLTARGEEYDKVLGLDAGADDYLAKPFGMMELTSRVRALLRRAGATEAPASEGETLRYGDITLCPARHTVTAGGASVALTLKEFELLHRLMGHPGVVYTRDVLLDDIWGYQFEGGTRTVDVHIGSLRQKLGAAGGLIQTVRGVGYKLDLGEKE